MFVGEQPRKSEGPNRRREKYEMRLGQKGLPNSHSSALIMSGGIGGCRAALRDTPES